MNPARSHPPESPFPGSTPTSAGGRTHEPFAYGEPSSPTSLDRRGHTRLLSALSALRTELADLAFDLEKRPQLDAADLACVLVRRLESIVAEATSPSSFEVASAPCGRDEGWFVSTRVALS